MQKTSTMVIKDAVIWMVTTINNLNVLIYKLIINDSFHFGSKIGVFLKVIDTET